MMANEWQEASVPAKGGGLSRDDFSPKLTKAQLLSTVFITATPKGGAGKTELTECLEATITLGGKSCQLIDVDDGNRGIARRVGKQNIVKLEWSTPVTAAANWVERYAQNVDSMVFDLGAGIDSSDLPVMAFLGSVWRMLADSGARVVVCAVVSTNAPTSAFIGRIDRKYGSLGEVLVVCNNQDGSREYPAELETLAQRKVDLGQLPAGIQAVRLSRLDRLSSVLLDPSPGYRLASALMAQRVFTFARQPIIREFLGDEALQTLRRLSEPAPKHVHFVVGTRAQASDAVIEQNARVGKADLALRDPFLSDPEILARAHALRHQHAEFAKLIAP